MWAATAAAPPAPLRAAVGPPGHRWAAELRRWAAGLGLNRLCWLLTFPGFLAAGQPGQAAELPSRCAGPPGRARLLGCSAGPPGRRAAVLPGRWAAGPDRYGALGYFCPMGLEGAAGWLGYQNDHQTIRATVTTRVTVCRGGALFGVFSGLVAPREICLSLRRPLFPTQLPTEPSKTSFKTFPSQS